MEILFYNKHWEISVLEVSESFYLWLAHSEFSKLEESEKILILQEDERAEIDAVRLNEVSRSKYVSFFQKCILKDSYELVQKIESSNHPSILKASSPSGSIQNLTYNITQISNEIFI